MPGERNDDTQKIFGATKGKDNIVVTVGAYSANDVVGGLLEFDVHGASDNIGGGGRITDIYLTDARNQAVEYTLYIFDVEPTAIADNGAWPTGIDIDDQNAMILEQALATARYATTINSLDRAHIPDIDQDFSAPLGK